jgi:hypothetical protein
MNVEFPHPGVQTWTNPHGIQILRLHYSADPDKTAGWAAAQKAAMTNPADYEQEYEINFSAKLGTLLYQMTEEATLEQSFTIPRNWTRYRALDPHPMVPHASLWVAVDPWGDAWAYRELWPSRVYGLPGNIPEDDARFTIKEYVEAVKFLESAENPENDGKAEKIYKQVIDYAARAFGKGTSDDPEQPNFQQRFELAGLGPFQDCRKDNESAISVVNEWLRPRQVEQPNGKFLSKSRLHIFKDKCPELIHEIKSNRFQQLTPLLADRQDPTGKPQPKRNHVTDCLKYLCMAGLEYVDSRPMRSTWKPAVAGINY